VVVSRAGLALPSSAAVSSSMFRLTFAFPHRQWLGAMMHIDKLSLP
jgi:hypothetical protein